MFDLRRSTSIAVSTSNEYCFTKVVNARRHGLSSQNRNNFKQHKNTSTHSFRLLGNFTGAFHFVQKLPL
jgi:hypothetical protein